MGVLLLGIRLLLAAVFGVAAIGKLAGVSATRKSLVDFGLPTSLTKPVGVLLPLAELTVAVALVPIFTAWSGAVGALALLLIFSVAIIFNLARGRTPDCNCFGQLHSAPVGRSTLVRNGVLAAAAGLLVWQGPGNVGLSAFTWVPALTAIQIVGFIFVIAVLGLLAAEGSLVLQLLPQQGRLLLRIDALEARLTAGTPAADLVASQPAAGLPLGLVAPDFQIPDLNQETHTLASLRAARKPIVLVFSDPDCGPCNSLLPHIALWQRDHSDRLTIALISRGTPEVNRAQSSKHDVRLLLLQQDREVALDYEVTGTPGAVLIHPDGRIGSALALGAEAIEALIARAAGLPAPAYLPAGFPAPVAEANGYGPRPHTLAKVGDSAGSFKFPDLTGQLIDFSAFRGHETLVLFWNPGCGFCNQMLDDLKAWESHPPPGAPKLLVVSSGSRETNQAMGLRSPIVLDQTFDAGRAFGVTGTPSAVLLDTQARIASPVVVGATAILALAAMRQPAA
jgi:peroxiredoxin